MVISSMASARAAMDRLPNLGPKIAHCLLDLVQHGLPHQLLTTADLIHHSTLMLHHPGHFANHRGRQKALFCCFSSILGQRAIPLLAPTAPQESTVFFPPKFWTQTESPPSKLFRFLIRFARIAFIHHRMSFLSFRLRASLLRPFFWRHF
ncbi:hypothetical protein GPALN_002229 [Globodera pallida]|nr:hypothetical protein GPALN_002229 [Globodera pallida]